jgi:hypothetical protein
VIRRVLSLVVKWVIRCRHLIDDISQRYARPSNILLFCLEYFRQCATFVGGSVRRAGGSIYTRRVKVLLSECY